MGSPIISKIKIMRKKDVFIALLAGVITGLLWAAVFNRLGTFNRFGLGTKVWGLAIVIPIIFVIGLLVGNILSKWRAFFSSFTKFVIVGFMNAGIDFAIYNLEIYISGIQQGKAITLFKTVSFLASFINSYYWSKYWTFGAGETRNKGTEFAKFAVVTVIGAVLNIGITSGIVNLVPPQFGFSQLGWDNIAAVVAAIANLIWNFIGYRLIVFKIAANKAETA